MEEVLSKKPTAFVEVKKKHLNIVKEQNLINRLDREQIINEFEAHDYWLLSNRENYPHPYAKRIDLFKKDFSAFTDLDVFKNRTYFGHKIENSIFSGLDLSNSLIQSDIHICKFEGANLSGCSIGELKISNTSFKNGNLSNVKIFGTVFSNCTFENACFNSSTFEKCNFIGCKFDNSEITDCNIKGAAFINSDLVYVNFEKTFIRGFSIRENSICVGCNFPKEENAMKEFSVYNSIFHNDSGENDIFKGKSNKFKNVRMAKNIY